MTEEMVSFVQYYQKSMKNIVKDENITAKIPVIVGPDLFLCNPGMKLIEEWHQEAYKLLSSSHQVLKNDIPG